MRLIFSRKKQEAGDAFSFFFRAPKPLTWQAGLPAEASPIGAKAGQFLVYTIDHPNPDSRGIRRYFTIASAPFEKHIMLTTRVNLEKGSTFKRALFNLQKGALVQAEGPRGSFIVEDPKQEYVFIAGGIGITPYRTILLDLDYRKLPINGKLLYANRTSEFVYQQELEDIAESHKNLHIHYFVEPERITEQAIQKLVPNLAKPIFYVSGPPPMVEAVESILFQMGIPSGRVREDHFSGYDWP